MGTLMLVRHGQASLGADDYDQLSARGAQQCHRLGEYWRERGVRVDAVYTGTLRRHAQSLAALREGFGALPAEVTLPALDEYDSEALIRTVHEGPLTKPTTADEAKQHFRLLRDGLLRWIAGESTPEGMPSFADFAGGIAQALAAMRERHVGQRVLVVSSGGPISTALSQVLQSPPTMMIELNMRLRNSALSELAITPRGLAMLGYNALPHLDSPAHAHWITSA